MFRIEDFQIQAVTTEVSPVDYGVYLLGAEHYWTKTRGEGIGVAVIDTGIDVDHPDLRPNIKNALDMTGQNDPRDYCGHGSHVSGIIAGCDNGQGIIGIAPKSELHSLKVLNDRSSGDFSPIVQALNWVIGNHSNFGIRVISMSLGSSAECPPIEQALVTLKGLGIVTVCAAGNDGNVAEGNSDVDYPAKLAAKGLCISVGAVDVNSRLASFSSTGLSGEVTLVSPGVDILSTYPGGNYAKMSGTSMATPAISGLIALLLSHHKELTNMDLVKDKLKALSKDLGSIYEFGFGLPNLDQDQT